MLKKDGHKYYTNIVIFTKDFTNEVNVKTNEWREKIADTITEAVANYEKDVRNIGFYGADMGSNSFAWQMASLILYQSVIRCGLSLCRLCY